MLICVVLRFSVGAVGFVGVDLCAASWIKMLSYLCLPGSDEQMYSVFEICSVCTLFLEVIV
ncbi:hypothetical protein DFH11DRAFT_1617634, partial [Phellopilus nigrolimitatus]